MEVFFWTALGLVAYSYAIYPLLMTAIGRNFAARAERARVVDRSRSDDAPSRALAAHPSVAVVVAAYNEERNIEARIRNVLADEYPRERLALYVGSDGSIDRTAAIALAHAGPRVHAFVFSERRGKASVLNELVAAVREDIVVFTDANTEFEPGAIEALVRRFDDPRIGAVSGELKLRRQSKGDNQDHRYWRVETAQKVGESRIGGLLGANGAIYAIRRELYRPLPADTIVDDFTVVMNVCVLGRQAVFEPAAVASEDAPPGIDHEFQRRVRIGIGNYQAFFRHPEYLLRSGFVRGFTYLSHKVLRWFTPHLLLAALAASAALADRPPYDALLLVQCAGYGALACGMILRRYVALPRVTSIPLFVFALNVAFLVGFWRYVTGSFSGQWRIQRA
jgi:cellulose synthase/poly-beta-1,6-N-acetylglucosamine synthase-like glycosyltransferase